MKILVFIPTYNRPEMCLQLLKDIKNEQKNHDLNVFLLNDASSMNYKPVREHLKKNFNQYTYQSNAVNHGKKFFWKTVNKAFEFARSAEWDYFIMLGDDLRLTDHFFDHAIKYYTSDNSIICLNLLTEYSRQRVKMWTDVAPVDFNENLMQTGWMDMCFVAARPFFNLINYQVLPVDIKWSGAPSKSSGVGMQLSKRIINEGRHFHQVKQSLVIHDDHPSIMHPTERKKNKLITNHKNILVRRIASVASMPERENALQKTINSIYPQVDEINVYLNDYAHVPDYLMKKGINVYRSQSEVGDLGDVGKFYRAEHISGYHFTIDDDLIYPPGYVDKLIKKIEEHGRKKVVSFHGRSFSLFPAKSYYKSYASAVSCLKNWSEDTPAHVVGTGVLGYHTSTVDVKLCMFPTLNMADIWFSKLCEEQDVERMILAHQAGWIKYTEIDFKKTIAGWHYNDDSLQTFVLNSINWKIVKTMSNKNLQPDVARKYFLKTIKPGKYNFKGFGEIDLCQLNIDQADRLVERGFPHLLPKVRPQDSPKTAPPSVASVKGSGQVKTDVRPSPKETAPHNIAAFRKNRDYTNKLLTLNWEDLNHQEKQIFVDEMPYFLDKKQKYFQIANLDRAMKSAHAKMRELNPDAKYDGERAKLIEKLTDMDAAKSALWKEIDTWKQPAQETDEQMKIKIAQKNAIATDRKIKAHTNYIWRGENELAKQPNPDRKKYLEKEIAKRKTELIELGAPYNRKSRKNAKN